MGDAMDDLFSMSNVDDDGETDTYVDAMGVERSEKMQEIEPPMFGEGRGIATSAMALRLDGGQTWASKVGDVEAAEPFAMDLAPTNDALAAALAERTSAQIQRNGKGTQPDAAQELRISDDLNHGYNPLHDRTPRIFPMTRRALQSHVQFGAERAAEVARRTVESTLNAARRVGAHDVAALGTRLQRDAKAAIAPSRHLSIFDAVARFLPGARAADAQGGQAWQRAVVHETMRAPAIDASSSNRAAVLGSVARVGARAAGHATGSDAVERRSSDLQRASHAPTAVGAVHGHAASLGTADAHGAKAPYANSFAEVAAAAATVVVGSADSVATRKAATLQLPWGEEASRVASALGGSLASDAVRARAGVFDSGDRRAAAKAEAGAPLASDAAAVERVVPTDLPPTEAASRRATVARALRDESVKRGRAVTRDVVEASLERPSAKRDAPWAADAILGSAPRLAAEHVAAAVRRALGLAQDASVEARTGNRSVRGAAGRTRLAQARTMGDEEVSRSHAPPRTGASKSAPGGKMARQASGVRPGAATPRAGARGGAPRVLPTSVQQRGLRGR